MSSLPEWTTTSNRTDGANASSGQYKTTVLDKGEYLVDTSDGGRLVTGDGVAVGGIPHVTQYPKKPFTAMIADFNRVYRNLTDRFVYPAGNYLWPGVKAQTNLCHQADTTIPPTAAPDLWTWATIQTPFYERWQLAKDLGDTVTANAVATLIAKSLCQNGYVTVDDRASA